MLGDAEGYDEEDDYNVDGEGAGAKVELAEAGEVKELGDTENEDADGGCVVKDEDGIGEEGEEEGDLEEVIFGPFFEGVD